MIHRDGARKQSFDPFLFILFAYSLDFFYYHESVLCVIGFLYLCFLLYIYLLFLN